MVRIAEYIYIYIFTSGGSAGGCIECHFEIFTEPAGVAVNYSLRIAERFQQWIHL